ncbi:MAG: sugar transferase, partial [Paracoccaceae bacterium]
MSYILIDPVAGVATPEQGAMRHYQRWGKRLFDLVIVMLILPIVLPVVLAAWLVTALGGGRGFYAQARIGRAGRVFRCWKIRTMRPDATRILHMMMAQDASIASEWQAHQKLRFDPRITRTGRFLRRTSVDELPQLWNVLTGEMSLIGPRPFTPDQRALYDTTRTNGAYYRLR